jgi:hypothetical protein
MQRAQPNESAFGAQTRRNNDLGVLGVQPQGNPRAGLGADVTVTRLPLPTDWEWHMQSREGNIRFRTGPDDPRIA